ncbi:S8 family serine peptidase [Streptomyces sp. NPDC004549]|uniref:S8 family peptidase n=1 Tax=Streptomyces sp. NPDC004549 TaxID=3154283 RepID=UPI0033A5E346
MKNAAAATVATAAAVALAAGMTSPASANPVRPASAAAKSAPGSTTGSTTGTGRHHVTLITGDRVVLDAKGRVVGLDRAKGREHIPVQVRKAGTHTLVVPADAARLLASGTLDQRLFDVTELNRPATRKAQRDGLKVIVGYRGAAGAARTDVRDAGTLRHSLGALDADAVRTPAADTTALWHAVTDGDRAASGIAHVWLDGVREAALDKSVPQIGAPTAWAAGYTGKGVKVAVLDTGVDTSHPDLKTQVIAAKNFSTARDATDHFGHGTHVASIVAGTGAKSGGKYKGVAPDARLLSGKVLDDDGFGDDSGILAGMEWAAKEGADVVNLSLGGEDSPGIDPLEAEVNKLSKEKGILFAIAAGNEGPHSVGSPGSADAALTVGAVDGKDKLADFSSTGPRNGDGAIKPDLTAPGVDITAAAAKGSVIDDEVGENPPGYLTISGTSMATPHVAGAAAILKQEHPDWGYAELKGALTGSTKGGDYTPFEQGSGRVQVDKAIGQSVIADPVSVSFPEQQWPHTDDKPVTKELTYRNLGDKDVTLDLSTTATGPTGKAAPAGFFQLADDHVTVPAHGKAFVGLTVDTRLGGTTDGAYSAYVTATGGGQSVRTAAAVQREVESYDVTLKFLGRNGRATPDYEVSLSALTGEARGDTVTPYDPSGTAKVRLPKGSYVLDSSISAAKGMDWIAQPHLSVTKNATVTVDARTARPVDITVPAKGAKLEAGYSGYDVEAGEYGFGAGWFMDSFQGLRVAHLGPKAPAGTLTQQWDTHWTKGKSEEYDTTTGGPVSRLATGYTKHYKASELATVKAGLGASAANKTGAVSAVGWLPDVSSASSISVTQKLPGTRTLHLSATGGAKWELDFEQYGGKDEDGFPLSDAGYVGDPRGYKAGRTYSEKINTAVFAPRVSDVSGVFREGNTLYGRLALFTDGAGHLGGSAVSSAHTTLYRNGGKVGSNEDPLNGDGLFTVPSGDAAYLLTTSVKRSAKVAGATSRVDASWTFRSQKKSDDITVLPVSSVRFGASVGLDGRVAAGKKVTFPVTVEGAAAGRNLKSLTVYVSYDGTTFTKVAVHDGRITVKNPAKNKSISFRAKIADKKGNTARITVHDAYRGK